MRTHDAYQLGQSDARRQPITLRSSVQARLLAGVFASIHFDGVHNADVLAEYYSVGFISHCNRTGYTKLLDGNSISAGPDDITPADMMGWPIIDHKPTDAEAAAANRAWDAERAADRALTPKSNKDAAPFKVSKATARAMRAQAARAERLQLAAEAAAFCEKTVDVIAGQKPVREDILPSYGKKNVKVTMAEHAKTVTARQAKHAKKMGKPDFSGGTTEP